jgi:mycothiol synthase
MRSGSGTDTSSAVRLRAPRKRDAPAILAVLAARDTADLGAPDYTLEDVLDGWKELSFDAEADAKVCETDGGEIVGYAAVRRPATQVAVAPDHEGQGIGTLLLRWAESRELELGWEQHRHAIAAGNSRAETLLRSSGYVQCRSQWRLARRLDGSAHQPTAPAGFRLRALRTATDAEALYALNAASFADGEDEQPASLAAFSARHLQAHDLDPTLSGVAVGGERVVGFLLARRWQEQSVGYVALLAVDPEEQGRGLGTALLQRALARFETAGLTEAQLSVAGDNPRALALYENVGMQPRFRLDVYERPLDT